MDTTNLRKNLTLAEGNIPYAYTDTEGFITIGIGRLIDKRAGGGLSEEEVQYLFTNDILNKTNDCRKIYPKFDSFSDSRKEALIELMFNLGISKLKSYNVLTSQINTEDWSAVQDNLRAWSRWEIQVGATRKYRIIDSLGK
jgi:lysozyme